MIGLTLENNFKGKISKSIPKTQKDSGGKYKALLELAKLLLGSSTTLVHSSGIGNSIVAQAYCISYYIELRHWPQSICSISSTVHNIGLTITIYYTNKGTYHLKTKRHQVFFHLIVATFLTLVRWKIYYWTTSFRTKMLVA